MRNGSPWRTFKYYSLDAVGGGGMAGAGKEKAGSEAQFAPGFRSAPARSFSVREPGELTPRVLW